MSYPNHAELKSALLEIDRAPGREDLWPKRRAIRWKVGSRITSG